MGTRLLTNRHLYIRISSIVLSYIIHLYNYDQQLFYFGLMNGTVAQGHYGLGNVVLSQVHVYVYRARRRVFYFPHITP